MHDFAASEESRAEFLHAGTINNKSAAIGEAGRASVEPACGPSQQSIRKVERDTVRTGHHAASVQANLPFTRTAQIAAEHILNAEILLRQIEYRATCDRENSTRKRRKRRFASPSNNKCSIPHINGASEIVEDQTRPDRSCARSAGLSKRARIGECRGSYIAPIDYYVPLDIVETSRQVIERAGFALATDDKIAGPAVVECAPVIERRSERPSVRSRQGPLPAVGHFAGARNNTTTPSDGS